MTDTNDTSRLSNLVNEIKSDIEQIKTALEGKMDDLEESVRQRVQELGEAVDQKLDELAAAFGPHPDNSLPGSDLAGPPGTVTPPPTQLPADEAR